VEITAKNGLLPDTDVTKIVKMVNQIAPINSLFTTTVTTVSDNS